MNRNVPPKIGVMQAVEIPRLECLALSNGIKLHYKNTADADLVRFDLVVKAGSVFQSRPMVAFMTNLLLKEGCKGLSSAQVAERFDAYGAFVYYSCSMEYATVTLCSPKRYFQETLALLRDLYVAPTFPARDLKIALAQRLQDYYIGREKVQVQAAQQMSSLLFGKEHPYGRILQESDFKHFDRELLRQYHRTYYRPENTFLVLTGDVQESECQSVQRIFGEELPGYDAVVSEYVYPPICPSEQKKLFLPKEDSVQAAVRLSMPVVGQEHPDFLGLKVMNTAFGGYFGSRLMKSIREEKGYTYGIYSTMTVYRQQSYLDIETQTAVPYAHAVIDAVYEEMAKMREKPMAEEELTSLRNYLSGEYARMMDGPFSLSDLFVSVETIGLDMSFYKQQMEVMRNITADDIQQLAQRYLLPDDFYVVRVGGKDTE